MYANDRTTIADRREMLRVKIKSLAAESRIIRLEEKRTHSSLREELYLHRVGIVRRAAREACVAYGLIRGEHYLQMEAWATDTPNWAAVKTLCKKYGPKDFVFPAELEAFSHPKKTLRPKKVRAEKRERPYVDLMATSLMSTAYSQAVAP